MPEAFSFRRLFRLRSRIPPPTAGILRHPDAAVRRAAAARLDVAPEIMCALAADADPTVRRMIAENMAAPAILSPVLARDQDVDVRSALLLRLVKLLPNLTRDQHNELYEMTVRALETLAQDHVRHVREALASTLKDVAYAPSTVVKCLAHDVEQSVAEPVLQLCRSLSDDDLLEIIADQHEHWALAAIATRRSLSPAVSGAIVATGDRRAGSLLLDNRGALIEDDIFAEMVEASIEVDDWRPRLAARPDLPRKLAFRLAEFVDRSVLKLLQKRSDFDDETAREVVSVTRRRLDYLDAAAKEPPQARAARLMRLGQLDDAAIADAASWNDRAFVIAALGLLSRIQPVMVEKILNTRNGKTIVALVWRAKLGMRCAVQIQSKIALMPPHDLVSARNGDQFPLTEEQMLWQLDFIGAVKK